MNMKVLCVIVLLFSDCTLGFDDEFRFASYYGDHMVLQKAPERAVVWGFASKDSEVQLILSGFQTEQLKSVPVLNGTWKAMLDPVQAGGPYNLTAVWVLEGQEDVRLVLTDVMFGDVWLCGGQSNMAFTLAQVYNASEELALASKFPDVRIFQAALQKSEVQLDDLAGVAVPWSRPTPELLGGKDYSHFSAVCWLFGRHLYETLKYPIGLVESCWSGTPIEAWSSHQALHKCGLETDISWFMKTNWQNSVLWNSMIYPLLSMTIKGAIWYQGESNAGYNQDKYSCAFPAMIDDWRMAFHSASLAQTAPDFPFGFVQLCTYKKNSLDGFPEIRWHQTADFGFVPNKRMKKTFMAVAMDLPDETSPYGSIHPQDKQDVAYRLMLGARAVAYEEAGVSFQGPFPSQVSLNIDSTLNITFNQRISARLCNHTFEICCCTEGNGRCEDGSRWIPAPMEEIGTDHVVLSARCSVDPVGAVRYAWTDWPCDFKDCPVYSADRVLPAPPFVLALPHCTANIL